MRWVPDYCEASRRSGARRLGRSSERDAPRLKSVLAVPGCTFLKFHFHFLRAGRCLAARATA
jgi:hypothetical protein